MKHFTLFNQCWFIRMPVIVARCPRKWSQDFMTSSNEFYAFHRFADLQSSAFFWKVTVGQYFKSLANKSNSHECTFWIFFSMVLKDWEFLKLKLNFFSFGLADDQKSFNAACNNIFLHFWATIMDFFIILKC